MRYLKKIKKNIYKKYVFKWIEAVNPSYMVEEIINRTEKKSIREGLLTAILSTFMIMLLTLEIQLIGILILSSVLVFLRPYLELRKEYLNFDKNLNQGLESLIQKMIILLSAGMNVDLALSISQKIETPFPVIKKLFSHIEDEKEKGLTQAKALAGFARLYRNKYLNKFNANLVQSNSTGSKRLSENLKRLSEEISAERQNELKRRAEVLSTKLLMPLMLSMIGIIVMIMVPIFLQLQF